MTIFPSSPSVKSTFLANPKFSNFSLLIITLTGVYNEIQVDVKFSPLSILRNSRWRPENPQNWRNFSKYHIFVTMLGIDQIKYL